jgi:hypothetical protein
MYWNAVHAEQLEKEKVLREKDAVERPPVKTRGPSFDDFLQEDKTADRGTYVYNTGADVNHEPEVGLRNRGVRGLDLGSIYSNPFSDEQAFEAETQRAIEASLMSPDASERMEVMSDLYTASEAPRPSHRVSAPIAEQLIDVSEPVPHPPVSYPTMEDLHSSSNFANMAERDNSAFAQLLRLSPTSRPRLTTLQRSSRVRPRRTHSHGFGIASGVRGRGMAPSKRCYE